MSRIWSLLRLVPRRVPFPHTTRPWSWSLSSIRGFPSPKLPGKPGIPTAEALRYSCGSSCLQKALQENVKKLADSEPRCEGWDKMDTKRYPYKNAPFKSYDVFKLYSGNNLLGQYHHVKDKLEFYPAKKYEKK
ncbi:unnamed protein product [Clonostachys rosea f. rosea IK726]|uniref:Uncharacterized protein n=2 Tax=Bionectria ochroleuca TaxID=29856 RepID=A0A0B7KBP6_BIOOC|nr:unnamed protein product [Clonostachys rosea f. rosea IK726]